MGNKCLNAVSNTYPKYHSHLFTDYQLSKFIIYLLFLKPLAFGRICTHAV